MIPIEYCIAYEEQSMLEGSEVVLNRYSDFDLGEMHTHTFIEVCCVTQGSGWHILNDEIQHCSPGDIFIIDAGDAHMWVSEHDAQMTLNNLIFRPAFFDPSLTGKTSLGDLADSFLFSAFGDSDNFKSLGVHLEPEALKEAARLYDSMLAEYEGQKGGCIELIRAIALELMIIIFRRHSLAADTGSPAQRPGRASLAPVFDYINLHLGDDIPLRILAGLVYLSPTYFSRVFRLYTGHTVTEYIQRMRIFNARSQLTGTDMSVAAIAEANGYSDQKHFSRIFKRITGVSPTEYRSGKQSI